MIPNARWEKPDPVWSTDAYEDGCGGWSQKEFFHSKFPEFILKDLNTFINELECITIVVALKFWAPDCKGKKLLAYCDNEVMVRIINLGKAHNPFAQSCLREILYICAKNDTMLHMIYKEGAKNRTANSLSQWHKDKKFQNRFKNDTKNLNLFERVVTEQNFTFTHKW